MARWTQLFLASCDKFGVKVSLVDISISEQRSKNKKRAINLLDEINRTRRIIRNMKKTIESDNPDLIHLCSSCSRYGLMRDYLCVNALKRKPFVFHCHCNIGDQAKTKFSRYLLKKITKKSKRVIVLNSSSKSIIERIDAEKALLVPNFVEDVEILPPHYTSQHIEKVLFVGHVKQSKGIEELFRMALALEHITFNIVGPVQELPKEISMPSNVNLIGEVDQSSVKGYMAESDVFVFPSHTEGFANVMLEAMEAGLPILATDVGSNRDMIEDKGGLIVPVNDYNNLIESIIKMDNFKARSEMSSWNQKKVLTHYTQSSVIPQLLKCYEESI